MQGKLFSRFAFKDKSRRKDLFSGGACKKESCRGTCLHSGWGNCLAEVLSRISRAGKMCLAEML